jgi:hypothetical protein
MKIERAQQFFAKFFGVMLRENLSSSSQVAACIQTEGYIL